MAYKRHPRPWLIAVLLLLAAPAQAQEARVVVTVKPLHSLVAAVMEGDGQPPLLLVSGNASPHGFQLRPSQTAALAQADIVFAIGAQLEAFMPRARGVIGKETRVVYMAEQPGMFLLPLRTGGSFEAHSHEHEDGADEVHMHPMRYEGNAPLTQAYQAQSNWAWGNPPAPDVNQPAPGVITPYRPVQPNGAWGRAGEAQQPAAPYPEDAREYGMATADAIPDPHLWLDPMNAITMVDAIAANLAEVYPQHAALYRDNAGALKDRITRLDEELRPRMQRLAGKGFIVFHDAYQYFERAFGLRASGSVTVTPDSPPGAAHVMEIRQKIRQANVACIFREPQFDDTQVRRIVGGAAVRIGTLDPEGAALQDGPALYLNLLAQLARQLEQCLEH